MSRPRKLNKFEIIESKVKIYLSNELIAYCDLEDWEKIRQYTWRYCKDNRCIITMLGGKEIRLQRFILNLEKGNELSVTFKDSNCFNVCRDNLQVYDKFNENIFLIPNDIEIIGNKIKIKLTKNQIATIDKNTYDLVKNYRWHAVKYKANIWYAAAHSKGEAILMHRVLTGCPDGMVVDHRDRDGLNNTLSNLRLCTQSDNMKNSKMKITNKLGYKNISYLKDRDQYRVKFTLSPGKILLKDVKTLEQAIAYRNENIKKYYGEFVRLEDNPK